MKNVFYGMCFLCAILTSQANVSAQLSKFEGNFTNIDKSTGGVTRLQITTSGSFVKVRAWGKCSPTDCEWGAVDATATAPNASANIKDTATSVVADFKTGFADTIVTIRPAGNGKLTVSAYTKFTDNSGRSNYSTDFQFQKIIVPIILPGKIKPSAEDCLSYDPQNLKIVDENAAGWLLTDGGSRMLVLDDQKDAKNALAMARQHNQHCFVGRNNKRPNRSDYIFEYWQGDSGIYSFVNNEDCISFDNTALAVTNDGATGFLLADGSSRLNIFDNASDAQRGLLVAKTASEQCFIGRDNSRQDRKQYIVQYFK